tara:strand:- start:219 stop:608 length:390 start_codon:yes stop_codon:yes gene_type:complete
MAHFAKIEYGKVAQVIVADQEFIDNHTVGTWVQTSYNTWGGKHYNSEGKESADQSKALRKNYAGKGFTYDTVKDAFIPPQPYASWTLNDDTCLWEPPIKMPSGSAYKWNEEAHQADNTKGWEDTTENLL